MREGVTMERTSSLSVCHAAFESETFVAAQDLVDDLAG
jgi:hypothetical protein